MGWLKKAGFLVDIRCAVREKDPEGLMLPDWASFLIWLGFIVRKLQYVDKRVFCVLLLPTRVFCSALTSFGAIANSLTNPENELCWELFLKCEEGLNVYFLYKDKRGKAKQVEGKLGKVIEIDGQILRSIKVIPRRKDLQGLTIQIGETKFKDSNVSFHPHYRSHLLNEISHLSKFFRKTLDSFNENRLLMHNIESAIVTNCARCQRENNNFFLKYNNDSTDSVLNIKEVTLSHLGRTLYCSPKSRALMNIRTPLAILDGLDALRSREFIQARNFIILLEQGEFDNEAEDVLTKFSGYCCREVPPEFNQLPVQCPDGIEVQFYVFK